jgi:hypothetical protein
MVAMSARRGALVSVSGWSVSRAAAGVLGPRNLDGAVQRFAAGDCDLVHSVRLFSYWFGGRLAGPIVLASILVAGVRVARRFAAVPVVLRGRDSGIRATAPRPRLRLALAQIFPQRLGQPPGLVGFAGVRFPVRFIHGPSDVIACAARVQIGLAIAA